MQIEILVLALFILIVILSILLIMLFLKPSKKEVIKDECITLECISKVFKDSSSSTSQLSHNVDLILKHHGVINNFETYLDLFYNICKHKNATTEMIVLLDKELSKLNPTHKKTINESIAKGLKARK